MAASLATVSTDSGKISIGSSFGNNNDGLDGAEDELPASGGINSGKAKGLLMAPAAPFGLRG